MTNEELNRALYDKMSAEMENYRNWLMAQSPEDILRNAYEYAVREDIVLSLEYNDLNDAQAQALLDSENPLQDVFDAFEKMETGYMDSIQNCLENVADEAVHAKHEYLLSLPFSLKEISSEAQRIMDGLQAVTEPNSPHKTHFMVEISPDFLRRATDKNMDTLICLLPFRTLSVTPLKERKGTFAMISKNEDRASKTALKNPEKRKNKKPQTR